jgi:hypothetical protein
MLYRIIRHAKKYSCNLQLYFLTIYTTFKSNAQKATSPRGAVPMNVVQMKNVQGTGFFGNLWRGFVIGAEEVSGYAYDMTPMGVADWLGDFFKPCPSRAKAGFKKSPSGGKEGF